MNADEQREIGKNGRGNGHCCSQTAPQEQSGHQAAKGLTVVMPGCRGHNVCVPVPV